MIYLPLSGQSQLPVGLYSYGLCLLRDLLGRTSHYHDACLSPSVKPTIKYIKVHKEDNS